MKYNERKVKSSLSCRNVLQYNNNKGLQNFFTRYIDLAFFLLLAYLVEMFCSIIILYICKTFLQDSAAEQDFRKEVQ
jgi:hypothetical protein